MRKHFALFYSKHIVQSDEQENKGLDDLSYHDITDDLVGKWCTYLTDEARCRCNPKLALLTYASVAQYFSSFKMYCIHRFHSQPIPPPLVNEKTKHLSRLMLKKKIQQARLLGKSLFGSIEAADGDDWLAFAAVCFWDGSRKSAEFLHLFKSCIDNSGRGSEVSHYFLKFCIIKCHSMKFLII